MPTWVQKKVIFCEPVTPAPEITLPGCLAGEGYSAGIAYVPTSDPGLPDFANADIAIFVFATVITVYLLSAGLGAVMSLFRARST